MIHMIHKWSRWEYKLNSELCLHWWERNCQKCGLRQTRDIAAVHTFAPWETARRQMFMRYPSQPQVQTIEYNEEYQRRVCLQCGLEEERILQTLRKEGVY